MHPEAVHQETPPGSEPDIPDLQDSLTAPDDIPENAMPTTTPQTGSGTRSEPTSITQQPRRGSTSSRSEPYPTRHRKPPDWLHPRGH